MVRDVNWPTPIHNPKIVPHITLVEAQELLTFSAIY